MVDPEREDAAAGAPADPESPASGEEWAGREPREGDAILGATLDALKRAAQGVEIERQVAETLQRSLLPRLPVVPGLRLAARYRPGSAVTRIGGDWYDAIALRGGKVGIAIGDVVGRGVEAAARMAHLQSALRAYALEALRPAVVLERMNSFVLEGEQGGMVTLLYAIVDPDGQTVQVASAGHPPPLVLDPDGGSTFVEAPAGSPLGVTRYAAYEESVTTLDRCATQCSARSTCGRAFATTSHCSPFSSRRPARRWPWPFRPAPPRLPRCGVRWRNGCGLPGLVRTRSTRCWSPVAKPARTRSRMHIPPSLIRRSRSVPGERVRRSRSRCATPAVGDPPVRRGEGVGSL